MKIITLPNGSAIAAHAITAVTLTKPDDFSPSCVHVHFDGRCTETCFTGSAALADAVRDQIIAEWQAATQDSEP